MQDSKGKRDTVLTRSGYVALVGRPNVGKSTLLNALVGERLSIVTPRPQTTRDSVTGILTRPDSQIVFVDTPGLMDVSYLLHEAMLQSARSALEGSDVVLLLLDGTQPDDVPGAEVLAMLEQRRGSLVVAVNKTDEASPAAVAKLAEWTVRELEVLALAISAVKGDGLEQLTNMLVERLPESPYLFAADEIAIQPVRFFVEELVRETVFEVYGQEVPYSTAIRIEEYRESEDPVFIRAVVYVERESQRGIVIGQGGARIRELGMRSRTKIEAFVGGRVYLDLWVKVLPGWRRKADALRRLGYDLPGRGKPGR